MSSGYGNSYESCKPLVQYMDQQIATDGRLGSLVFWTAMYPEESRQHFIIVGKSAILIAIKHGGGNLSCLFLQAKNYCNFGKRSSMAKYFYKLFWFLLLVIFLSLVNHYAVWLACTMF